MGLDRAIRFPTGQTPTWEAVRTHLRQVGEEAPLRMIDGLPAFPDEAPDDVWKELRVGMTAGMVTVRRGVDSLTCIVWGNSETDLKTAWDKLCWACAAAGGGVVDTPGGPLPADAFARSAGISPS
ncbi:MAG: hypothetical protein JWO38_838 [Gemmataceae bacterium]|nr:hypothetical protein [Gemmataceae bacterium]